MQVGSIALVQFIEGDAMRSSFYKVLSLELLLGLVLRIWLAFSVFQGQGFAWDLSTFADWMQTIRDSGHAAYSADPSINYPPVFAQLLQFLNGIGGRLSCCSHGPWLLLKWLPILADVGIALLLAYAGRRWYSQRTALWAAGLYLFIPVTWYDSAVWGQMDSVAALPMLAALILIINRRPEWSAVLLVAGILTKPQAVLATLIFVPVLLSQVLHRELPWWRIPTTFAAGLAGFVTLVNTWSLSVYVEGAAGSLPVVGNLLGLAEQYFSTAGLFPYMSVNAYNMWALTGDPSMASQFATREVTWTTDNYTLFGQSAHAIGLGLFAFLCVAIFVGLLLRHDARAVFIATAIILVSFFAVTTRVHERYLVHAFAILALVWSSHWWKRVLLVCLAAVNTLNLHAILVGGIRTVTNVLGEPPLPAKYEHHGSPPEFYNLSWPQMPDLGALRYGVVLTAIALVSAALVALVVEFVAQQRSYLRIST